MRINFMISFLNLILKQRGCKRIAKGCKGDTKGCKESTRTKRKAVDKGCIGAQMSRKGALVFT